MVGDLPVLYEITLFLQKEGSSLMKHSCDKATRVFKWKPWPKDAFDQQQSQLDGCSHSWRIRRRSIPQSSPKFIIAINFMLDYLLIEMEKTQYIKRIFILKYVQKTAGNDGYNS